MRGKELLRRVGLALCATYVGGSVGLLADGHWEMADLNPLVPFLTVSIGAFTPYIFLVWWGAMLWTVYYVVRKAPLWSAAVLVPVTAFIAYCSIRLWRSG